MAVDDHRSDRQRQGEAPPVRRIRLRRILTWKWLIGLAFLSGMVPVTMAFTIHDRCSSADPACVYHHYTLVGIQGAWILILVGAPALISLAVAVTLHRKVTYGTLRTENAAWALVGVSCFISFVGLLIEGFAMLLPAALTIGAVAVAPAPPTPRSVTPLPTR